MKISLLPQECFIATTFEHGAERPARAPIGAQRAETFLKSTLLTALAAADGRSAPIRTYCSGKSIDLSPLSSPVRIIRLPKECFIAATFERGAEQPARAPIGAQWAETLLKSTLLAALAAADGRSAPIRTYCLGESINLSPVS